MEAGASPSLVGAIPVLLVLDLRAPAWQAPGEAEAELAYLNRVGVIDGIFSDDVDNFLFGALTVIRKCVGRPRVLAQAPHSLPCSPGRGLTGNLRNPALNAKGKDDGNHVQIYKAANIASDETVALTRAGFILIGLLTGGDYGEVCRTRILVPTCMSTDHDCSLFRSVRLAPRLTAAAWGLLMPWPVVVLEKS